MSSRVDSQIFFFHFKTNLHHSQRHLFLLPAYQTKNLQIELLEMQRDSIVMEKYFAVGVPDFYSYLPEQDSSIKKFACYILALFGITYRCEQLFSFMKLMKGFQQTKLTDDHSTSLIRVGTVKSF